MSDEDVKKDERAIRSEYANEGSGFTIVSDIIDGRWTCNSQDSEGLVQPYSGGPIQLSKCPKCNSDAVMPMYGKMEGRFEEYQETVGCEECKAQYTVHYSIAFKAVKVTAVSK